MIPDELRERFHLQADPELEPRYNIAPTQLIAVIRPTAAGDNELVSIRWGLIPSWSDDPGGPPLINARVETVTTRPSFRESFQSRRCLVPADGYYEWKAMSGYKQPYHIRRRDRRLFFMAGLWDRWLDGSGKATESCAIVTTGANSVAREVHDRMPVVLTGDAWKEWLDHDLDEAASLGALVATEPDQLEVEAVDTAVNRVANDSPDCLRPAEINLELGL